MDSGDLDLVLNTEIKKISYKMKWSIKNARKIPESIKSPYFSFAPGHDNEWYLNVNYREDDSICVLLSRDSQNDQPLRVECTTRVIDSNAERFPVTVKCLFRGKDTQVICNHLCTFTDEIIKDEQGSNESADKTASDKFSSECVSEESSLDKQNCKNKLRETVTSILLLDDLLSDDSSDETFVYESASGESFADESASDESSADESASDESSADETASDESSADDSASDESSADKTASAKLPSKCASNGFTLDLEFNFILYGLDIETEVLHCDEEGIDLADETEKNLEDITKIENLADVRIQVGKKIFTAHKFILRLRAPKFVDMHLRYGSKTTLYAVKSEIFKSFIVYIYTNEISAVELSQYSKELYEVAGRYDMKPLQKICTEELKKKLNLGNVVEHLKMAEKHKEESLKRAAFLFIKKNLDEMYRRADWKKLIASRPSIESEVLHLSGY